MEENLKIFDLWRSMQFLSVMSDLTYMMIDRNSIDDMIHQLRSNFVYSTQEKIAFLSVQAIKYKRLGSPIAAMHVLFGACQLAVYPGIIAEIYRLMFSYHRHIGTGSVDHVLNALEYDLSVLKSTELIACKAQLQIELEEYHKAVSTLREALTLDPYDQIMTGMLAELYIRLNKSENAEELLNPYLKKKPKDHKILCLKAKQEFSEGNLDEAIEFFTKASKIDKTNAEYKLLLAAALQQKNETKKALKIVDDVMGKKTQDDKAWREIGVYYSQLGVLDLAICALERAIRYNNREPEYVRDLMIAYRKKGELDKAITLGESKVERYPQSDRITRILGDLYLIMQDHEKAEMYARKAIEASSRDPFLVVMLGDILYRKGDAKEAEEEFKKAIEMNKSNPEINVQVGMVYLNQWMLEEAETYFKAALSMIPNYQSALRAMKLLKGLSKKKVDPQKVYKQFKSQLMALSSDELPASEDGHKIHINLFDAIVDDPDSEGFI